MYHCPLSKTNLNLPRLQAVIYSWIIRGIFSLHAVALFRGLRLSNLNIQSRIGRCWLLVLPLLGSKIPASSFLMISSIIMSRCAIPHTLPIFPSCVDFFVGRDDLEQAQLMLRRRVMVIDNLNWQCEENGLALPTGGTWLSQFVHSITLCARATRGILGHDPIGEYRARFIPNEPTACPCDEAALETRLHILMDCPRFPKDRITSQTPLLKDLIQFLSSNPPAFAFLSVRRPP